MNYIDTHFHLDLWKNPEQFLRTLERKKIYTIAVTNAPSVFHHTYNMTKNRKFIRPALGFHPELVAQRRHEIESFLEQIELTRYIGEIGLDYSNHDDRNIQRRVFEQIVEECARRGNKVLTIHSRRAYKDVIDIIGNDFPSTVILHWYSGSLGKLQTAIAYGFYFSVNYAMTVSENGRKIISQIPLDRLLTESDGPFVNCNNEKSSPLHMAKVINEVSGILSIDEKDLQQQVFNNFSEILKICS